LRGVRVEATWRKKGGRRAKPASRARMWLERGVHFGRHRKHDSISPILTITSAISLPDLEMALSARPAARAVILTSPSTSTPSAPTPSPTTGPRPPHARPRFLPQQVRCCLCAATASSIIIFGLDWRSGKSGGQRSRLISSSPTSIGSLWQTELRHSPLFALSKQHDVSLNYMM
jgi:hypothetical protein